MSRSKKISAVLLIVIAIFGTFVMLFQFKVFGTYSAEITGVPDDVVDADIEYLDENWNSSDTTAIVSLKSGTASVSGMTETGYYTVTFCTATKEIGKAEFFLGNSGKLYSYDYELKENDYKPVYSSVNEIKYESYGYGRILDISGDTKVPVKNIPNSAVSADISVSLDNGDYGYSSTKISVTNETVEFDLGISGYYWITFFDSETNAIGTAEFTLDEEKNILINDFVYNSSTDDWEEKLVQTDTVYFASYDEYEDLGSAEDEVVFYSASIQNVPDAVDSVETQHLDSEMNQSECYAEVKIEGDGTVSVSNLTEGYYTFNYYDSLYNCIGCTAFYLDENGEFYSYDKLTKIETIEYLSLEKEKSYNYGNMSVSVYGVPEKIDTVETYYYYGDESDEAILFEPEFSSLTIEPLILSNLGMEGKYCLNFFADGVVVGNAQFYLDESGNIYDIDYKYNSTTDKWEETLVKTSEVYYYDNTDIEDADDYEYGNVELSITDVPAIVKYAEVTFFENDDTFTAGSLIFPDVTINGNGTVTINNLGTEGYYEVDLISGDMATKVGYVFVYIDSDGSVYSLESQINTDTFQVEITKTKMTQIPLKEYLSSTVDYISGDYNVNVYDVPKTVNKMLLTVVLPDGSYSKYEDKISIDSDGVAAIKNLGMEGNYTISFYTDKDCVGSATFYIDENGKIYKANYVYDDSNNISISLTSIDKVVFEENSGAVSYELGDIDFNGNINIADAVLLQKYLSALQQFSASQWYNADINADGSVNVFDMCLIRKTLLEKDVK